MTLTMLTILEKQHSAAASALLTVRPGHRTTGYRP